MPTKILHISDDIELDGRIYFIPDKYIEHKYLGIEHIKLYKFILASIINNHLIRKILQNITLLTQTNINNYIQICDKIFSYIITGKINTIIQLTNMDKDIINNIPTKLIPKLNLHIIETIK